MNVEQLDSLIAGVQQVCKNAEDVAKVMNVAAHNGMMQNVLKAADQLRSCCDYIKERLDKDFTP